MLTTTQATIQDISAMVEATLSQGNRITVKMLSDKFGLKIAVVRQMLINHYGNRIVFKRGRTGGIHLNAA